MGDDEGQEDEEPVFAWLPPDDRLWRHPSEVGSQPGLPTATRPAGPAGHIWTVAMAAGVVGALVASAVLIAVGTMHPRTTTKFVSVPSPRPPTSILANKTVNDTPVLWSPVAASLAPSVVAVSIMVAGSQSESGSGVVFAIGNQETDIITASDLVSQPGAISVSFDGGQSQKAKRVGIDPITGIAVISVGSTNHVPPSFGILSELSPAQDVMALGANNTDADAANYTSGPIYSLDQSVTDQNDSTLVGMLEFGDGTVSPDTDGGAIVDLAGSVVGIYSLVASGGSSNQDEAFAVPIDTARHVATLLMAGQTPTHPWLGIGSALPVTLAGKSTGAQIGSVCPGSPAAQAGIKPGDVVTAVARQRVSSPASLITLVANDRVAQSVRVAYHTPQGAARTVTLKVANQPATLAC